MADDDGFTEIGKRGKTQKPKPSERIPMQPFTSHPGATQRTAQMTRTPGAPVLFRSKKTVWDRSSKLDMDVLNGKTTRYWADLYATAVQRGDPTARRDPIAAANLKTVKFDAESMNYFTLADHAIARNQVLLRYFTPGFKPVILERNGGAGGDTMSFVYSFPQTPYIFMVEERPELWPVVQNNIKVVTQYWKRDYDVIPLTSIRALETGNHMHSDSAGHRLIVDVFYLDPPWARKLGQAEELTADAFMGMVMDDVRELEKMGVFITLLVVKSPFGREQLTSLEADLSRKRYTLVHTLVFDSMTKDREYGMHIFMKEGLNWKYHDSALHLRDLKGYTDGEVSKQEQKGGFQAYAPPPTQVGYQAHAVDTPKGLAQAMTHALAHSPAVNHSGLGLQRLIGKHAARTTQPRVY